MDLSKTQVCLAPWVNLHIQTTGQVKPCCAAAADFEQIQEGWNYKQYATNSDLVALKHAQVNNTLPDYCKSCPEQAWFEEFKRDVIEIKQVEDFAIQSIDARWSNTCNLTCTYCDKDYSSSWDALEGAHTKSKKYPAEIDSLFEFIEQNINSIKRVSLVGGEPLLMKENYRLLELLPDHVKIDVITNLSIDLDSSPVYKLLLKRSAVAWNVSMETLGDKFEFVRRGANWQKQVSNLHKLTNDTNHSATHSRYLLSTFCAYSATNLTELYAFARLFTGLKVKLSTLSNPVMLDFFKWPDQAKAISLQQIDGIVQSHNADVTKLADDEIANLMDIKTKLEASRGQARAKIIVGCVLWHKTRETKYFNDAKDFLTLWPQYKQLLNT